MFRTILIVLASLILLNPAFAQSVHCVENYADSIATHSTTEHYFISDGDSLFGTVYMPGDQNPKGLVILVPGGGNNVEILRMTPRFLSRRMANCGLATLTFDKRGIGNSGGDYESTTFDDFINDSDWGGRIQPGRTSGSKHCCPK
jgi:hypothetical protein